MTNFSALAEHLNHVDPVIRVFCERYGFERNTIGEGRYPRRWIVRRDGLGLFFDLQMDLDPDGKFFTHFFEAVPYSMGCGAWIDIGGVRHSRRLSCFKGRPFSSVKVTLADDLERYYAIISVWTTKEIENSGEVTVLTGENGT